jgi:hypothetical protein
MKKSSGRRKFLKSVVSLSVFGIASGISFKKGEGFRIAELGKNLFGPPEAYGMCGAGVNCAGGGGMCGAGVNCGGSGGGPQWPNPPSPGPPGGGMCGAGVNCAGQ